MSIVVNNLYKQFGAQKAVDHISFEINKGEIVGFLGPNGAGKSTTMKMITGYLKPDGGSATISGVDVLTNPLEAKKRVGYLPEANPLYYEMFVKEYLDFIGGIHNVSNLKQRINEVIDITGLGNERIKKIGQLSKGYKQRVGLAAALIHEPEVLILDEPTSGLDPNQIIEIRNVIKDQGKNKTVMFSSHILQEVEAICDRVIIINKGVMVANDTLTNLKQTGGDSIVKVTFKEAVSADVFTMFSGVDAVIRTDDHTWQFRTESAAEVKKQILELSLHRNLNIVSLQTEGSNLEDIFRSLTISK